MGLGTIERPFRRDGCRFASAAHSLSVRTRLRFVVLALILASCDKDASRATGPPTTQELRLQAVRTDLAFPVFLAVAPGDTSRLFVVEKGGRVRVIRNGALRASPFLDVTNLVSRGSEQGLLGLAFDPQYASNGRFFVSYTDGSGNSQVVRYRVSSNPDSAVPAPDVAVLSVAQPYENHNGGMILFGPDGMLYFGLGDGGGSGDPLRSGQDRRDLLGSLLRLDVSGGGYTVPPDNPFTSPDRGEVWSYGLRNPWRFSFDRQTGDLYIGDVGQDAREEIDVSAVANGAGRGVNFGWNVMEAFACFDPPQCNQQGLALPAVEYDHGSGCSVTGGYVYRGSAIPSLRGTYFYADYCRGWVRSFRYTNGQVSDARDWLSLRPGGSITSFGEDAAGELYVLTEQGGVYRIVP